MNLILKLQQGEKIKKNLKIDFLTLPVSKRLREPYTLELYCPKGILVNISKINVNVIDQ